jgi:hypothetical protein
MRSFHFDTSHQGTSATGAARPVTIALAIGAVLLTAHAVAGAAVSFAALALITAVSFGAALASEAQLRWHPRAVRPSRSTTVDDVIDASFPASDPPSWSTLRSGPPAS